jgi:hypothetical protein
MTEKEITALRAIYPEIPKNVLNITITADVNSEVQITCTFYPDRNLTEAGQKSVIVPADELKQIEDAIAFELGGEPCGLHEAHKLVKTMIQSSNGQANGGSYDI